MTATTPVVDVTAKTVTHAGTSFTMSPHSDDSYDVLLAGVPVGRVIFSFGAAAATVEGEGAGKVTEDDLTTIGEAWFAALEPDATES
jgi:hypothetical protein